MKKRILSRILIILLALFTLPIAIADLNIGQTPPPDAGTIYVGDTLTLTFMTDYSGSTDSRTAISIGFNPSGWTYESFKATMDTTDVSAGFTEITSASSIGLTNDALEPDEGLLTVSTNFTATAKGTYTFEWSSVFSIISGTNPDIETAMGATNAAVVSAIVSIESCDSTEAKKDTFDLIEDVYVMGEGYAPSTTYDIYVVEDVATWTDGMAIPSRVSGTAISVSSNASGNVPPTLVWSSDLIPGKYDIVVDVDGDSVYDEGTDALDDSDVEVTAGFNVIPEVPMGTIMASAVMIIALVAYVTMPRWRRKQAHINP